MKLYEFKVEQDRWGHRVVTLVAENKEEAIKKLKDLAGFDFHTKPYGQASQYNTRNSPDSIDEYDIETGYTQSAVGE